MIYSVKKVNIIQFGIELYVKKEYSKEKDQTFVLRIIKEGLILFIDSPESKEEFFTASADIPS